MQKQYAIFVDRALVIPVLTLDPDKIPWYRFVLKYKYKKGKYFPLTRKVYM